MVSIVTDSAANLPSDLADELGILVVPLHLTMGDRVCTNTNRPGYKLVATVNTAVVGSNGAVIAACSLD